MKRSETKVRKFLKDDSKSNVAKYKDLVIGKSDWLSLAKNELIVLACSWVPGALGLFLRSKLYPFLLGSVGKGVVFGCNVSFRHAHKIRIGSNVVIDDNCFIDAKGQTNTGVTIADDCFIGRNSILSCKDGDIELEEGVNLGFNSEIFSSSSVLVGANTMIAAYCYLVGGGNYDLGEGALSFAEQDGLASKGGILIEKNCWLGAAVKVLDGARIEAGAVVAAGAVVTGKIPANSIAAGLPARVIKTRGTGSKQSHKISGSSSDPIDGRL